MSDLEGQSSTVTRDESSLNNSPAATESSESLPATSPYFEAWLESVKPALSTEENLSPATGHYPQTSVAVEHRPAPGEFRFEGLLPIDCYVSGVISSLTGMLIVGQGGEVEADIFVANATINGLVRGSIHASESVELTSSARVIGNIETRTLSIQPGALFEGQCRFLPRSHEAIAEEDEQSSVASPTISMASSQRLPTEPYKGEMVEAELMVAVAGR